MNLSRLSNQELNLKMQSLVKKEREVLSDIILHIQEVQRRKLFLEMGYSSLFSYLTEFLGYSAASAMRRIDAARLVKEVPESLQKIESGKLNLSQVSVLQRSIRQVEKTCSKVSIEKKRNLVQEITGLSKQETEVIVAKKLEIEPVKYSTLKIQADESVKIEMSFSKEEWQQIELMKKLLSHSVQGELKDLMLYLARKVKTQKLGKAKLEKNNEASKKLDLKHALESNPFSLSSSASTPTPNSNSNSNPSSSFYPVNRLCVDRKTSSKGSFVSTTKRKVMNVEPVPKSTRRAVGNSLKKLILNKYKCCQYVDKKTNKKCESQWQLQIEHIQPVWAGGDNRISNLSLLCGQHNRYQYSKQIGLSSAGSKAL